MFTHDNRIYHTLRFAVAMCFFGHGAFGIITKQIWYNYFAVFGIGTGRAHSLMPIIGILDILMGISILLYPTRFVLAWLVVWGFITAMLRPMSGESFAEVIERAGNYGVPLALLLLCGIQEKGITGWFTKLNPVAVNNETRTNITNVLKIVVFLLLLGHGWLNFTEKTGLVSQYSNIGFANPLLTAQLVGIFEMAAAIIVLYRPIGSILIVLLVWKMGTELFYPHWELFEWIERGGSYGAILALFLSIPAALSRKRGTMLDHTYLLKEN
jgi:hypothetical protein